MNRLQGGGHLEMPQGYVERQRVHNGVHTDGSVDSPDEGEWVSGVVAKILTLGKCESVLDLGCRTGVTLAALEDALPSAYVKGVDIVPEFVEMAVGRGLDAQVADAHALPFADMEFDWVVCRGTFEHFYDVHLAMSEINRVARVGAYITCDLRDVPLGSDYAYSPQVEVWRDVMNGGRLKVKDEVVNKGYVEFYLCG